MDYLPDFWTALGIVLCLLAGAVTLLAVPKLGKVELFFARACFVAAAAVFEAKLAVWGATEINTLRLSLVALAGAAIALSLVGCLRWVAHKERILTQPASEPVQTDDRRPLTMKQIFDSDFPGVGKTMMNQNIRFDGKVFVFSGSEFWDIPTASYFLAFYVGKSQSYLEVSHVIAACIDAIRNNMGQVDIEVTSAGDTVILNNLNMSFSKQVYLYFDGELSTADKSAIEKEFSALGYTAHIRTRTYMMLHWNEHDRVPMGPGDNGVGVKLPKPEVGTSIEVRNRTGSLPPTTVVPDANPQVPAPPQPPT